MISESRELLGTKIEIFAEEKSKIEQAFQECERVEKAFSRFLDESEVAKLNDQVGEWVKVSEELFRLMEFAEKAKRQTEGSFDITVKSVLDSWGYDKEYSFKERNGGQLGQVDLKKGGMVRISSEIDLGGHGKGYALDCMVKSLEGCKDVCVNAGGDVYVRGCGPDAQPWKVYLEHPLEEGMIIGEAKIDGSFLASSSTKFRRWGDRHHLVDPKTGDCASDMLVVYVQADSGMEADAYATALFAMGCNKARQMVAELPVEALLVSPQWEFFRTDGFKGDLYMG